MTSEAIISELQTSMTSGMIQALNYEHITILILAQLLPQFNRCLRNSKLIYAIIGHHDDGRWAMYIGSTNRPQLRHAEHLSRTPNLS